jgi:hypothetical protein
MNKAHKPHKRVLVNKLEYIKNRKYVNHLIFLKRKRKHVKQTHIRCISYQMHIGRISDAYQMHIGRISDAYQMHIGRIRTHIRCISDAYQSDAYRMHSISEYAMTSLVGIHSPRNTMAPFFIF